MNLQDIYGENVPPKCTGAGTGHRTDWPTEVTIRLQIQDRGERFRLSVQLAEALAQDILDSVKELRSQT